MSNDKKVKGENGIKPDALAPAGPTGIATLRGKVTEITLPDGEVIQVQTDTAMTSGGWITPTPGTMVFGRIATMSMVKSQFSREGLPPNVQEVLEIDGQASIAVPDDFPGATHRINGQSFVVSEGRLKLGITAALEPLRQYPAGTDVVLICTGSLPQKPGAVSGRRPRINWVGKRIVKGAKAPNGAAES